MPPAKFFRQFFTPHGIPVSTEADATYGEAIHATVEKAGTNETCPILLMGHRDTVFPHGEAGRSDLAGSASPRLPAGRAAVKNVALIPCSRALRSAAPQPSRVREVGSD